MDSQIEIEQKLATLLFQLEEGVDEWILDAPLARYDLVQTEAKKPVAEPKPEQMKDAPKSSLTAFETAQSEEEIVALLLELLPAALIKNAGAPILDTGASHAEIAVIVDPPHRDAAQAQDLLSDPSASFLRKTLQTIGLDFDASLGKEPKASLRFLPILPWRMPQDRRIGENEAEPVRAAMAAKLRIGGYKAVLIAGANVAGLRAESGKLFGLPAFELVPPALMLREPMLKRTHWQALLNLHTQLDKILKL